MIRILSILFLLAFTTGSALAQSDEKSERRFWDRVYIGGDVSLNFGSVTLIGATPIIGYRISNRFSAGVGGTYLYYQQDIRGYGRYSTSIYGGNVFARFNVTEEILAISEFHVLNVEAYRIETNDFGRINVPIWYLGGGYRAQIAPGSYIVLMALFDVIEDPNSPYSNPQIRGGVSIGL